MDKRAVTQGSTERERERNGQDASGKASRDS